MLPFKRIISDCVVKPLTVIVEGNIGVGKSTFIESLSKNELIEFFPEPLDQWQNLNGHNLFDSVHRDSQRYSIPFQFFVMLTLLKSQLKKSDYPIRLFERSLQSSKLCFAEAMRLNGSIDQPMFDVLSEWYNFMDEKFPMKPDLIIYLTGTPEHLYNRIQLRGRSEERNITIEYLKLLHNLHEDYIHTQRSHTPVITLNSDLSIGDVKNQYDICSSKIMQLLYKTTPQ